MKDAHIPIAMFTGAALIVAGQTGLFFPQDADCYADVKSCQKDLGNEQLCQNAQKEALAKHIAKAPTFDTKESCEAKIGTEKCTDIPADHGAHAPVKRFMPKMWGYIVDKMTAADNTVAVPQNLATAPTYTVQPCTYAEKSVRRGGFGGSRFFGGS